MCYRPLHISSHNTYFNSCVSASTYDVPCGKCESCRDQYRNMWKCRLWHELDDTYKKNGIAVFLTFTYRDECLPTLVHNGISIPVFNHGDVKTFLNRLKVRMYRLYGKDSYKYFIAMEYGKHTKRQHLHGLFFLRAGVVWPAFVELCRDLWTHGFMFPKFSHGRYVKDNGQDDTPTIRNAVKGAVYVSKYVTKDLSYYDIPAVDALSVEDPLLLQKYAPKHYQSNNLGISILDKVNLSNKTDVLSFLTDGITVPFSDSRIPVPRYIKKKLLFENVKSDRLGSQGNVLYDSCPTTLLLSIRAMLYEKKVSKLKDSISKVFSRFRSLYPSQFIPRYDSDLLANYILYFKNCSNDVLHAFLTYYDGDVTSFADSSKVGFFYNLSCDNRYLKATQFRTDALHPSLLGSIYSTSFFEVYRLYCLASSVCEEKQVTEFHKRSDEREKVRYKYFYGYNKKLC